MSGLWPLAGQWLVAMAAGLAFVRWPGRIGGVAVALALWVAVGPWATWVALGLVFAGVVGWRIWGRGRRLVSDRFLAAVVVAGVLVVLADGAVASLAGAVVLAAVVCWLVRVGFPPADRREVDVVPAVRERVPVPSPAGGGLFDDAPRLVRFAPCERCGDVLATAARAHDEPAWFVARAWCEGCGVRLVGVFDAAGDPGSGLVWFEMPPSGDAPGWVDDGRRAG